MGPFRDLLRRHWLRWDESFPDLAATVRLGEGELIALEAHFVLLTEWNQRLNLSAVRDSEEIVVRHFCESLALASVLPSVGTVVDLGSGAGFPGVPLAVVRPACQVSLVESDIKKAVFLREASLGLANVRVLRARGEELAERTDWLVSRAVAWRDVRRVTLRSAGSAVLLVSGAQVADIAADSLFSVASRFPLPWSRQSEVIVLAAR